MIGAIVSREVIARQAKAAVDAGRALDANPYCEHMEPAHHVEWIASHKRYVEAAVPESESPA